MLDMVVGGFYEVLDNVPVHGVRAGMVVQCRMADVRQPYGKFTWTQDGQEHTRSLHWHMVRRVSPSESSARSEET